MRDYALFAFVIGLVPVILSWPWTGILVWYWVALMVPHSMTWGFMQSFPIAAMLGGASLIGVVIAKDRRPIPGTREIIVLGIFVAHMTLTSFFAVNQAGAWDQWIKVMKILLMTFLVPMLIYGERRILALIFVMTFSIGFYGFKGGLFAIVTGGNYSVLGPVNSFLEGNTFIGLAMIMVLPLILVSARLVYQKWVDVGWPWLQTWSKPIGLMIYASFWLTTVAILVTYSRGALLGLLAVSPFILKRMRRKWLIVSFAILGFSVIGISAPERLVARWETIETYEEDQSAMQRIQAWGANWNMAWERPFIGMGFRHAGKGYGWWSQYVNFEGAWDHVLSAHSIYFQILGQHGFVGFGIFLTLIGMTFSTLGRIRRDAVEMTGKIWLSEYAWAIQVSLVGFMAAGTFLDVGYFDLLYALIALAVILRRELDEADQSAFVPVAGAQPPKPRNPFGASGRYRAHPSRISKPSRRHPLD
ncbi:putative O-glycosylation ligase, exosortase A system-associated [Thiorhodococcus mannitoliphagus]|uniref:Putative O-glycosylation ligase, exosortase A system-associated n=1 Tax=Thiorhodococcus mannitoliphagus TaxID=329406 RepID=A0A6P1E4E0_9GAMM|nr:putative O-glycosylation ligase, exosortase A system-associated [Thiorhodococcus mannitoliphagus]NEX22535.1 putative O-glycosylation ligase, exosortase A system-associated [Thiorhodococcus mannitoliphagus]